MRPSALTEILRDALAYGNHSPDCLFEKSRKSACLPPRHPRHKPVLNIDKCDCWKKRAGRMLRAMNDVEPT
jgi:hypothetical protein